MNGLFTNVDGRLLVATASIMSNDIEGNSQIRLQAQLSPHLIISPLPEPVYRQHMSIYQTKHTQ